PDIHLIENIEINNRYIDLSNIYAKDLRIAVILDEFSYNSFRFEFKPIVIEPINWKDRFEKFKPHMFFCESAWSGTDSVIRPWKGKVYASENFELENRTELLDIINYCNENSIPTVFWNKEDPTHYDDSIHDFVKTAQAFDFVFTTAVECIESYKLNHGLKNVFPLPFATQPRLFNPITSNNFVRNKNIVFAGSWYANHIQRSKLMSKFFDLIIEQDYSLDFYNRYYDIEDVNHKIPKEYKAYEKPSIANEEIASVYKSSIFGLNINTVTQSQTMFARRVFELMSSNTFVISNYSVGIEKIFGDSVLYLDKNPNGISSLSDEQINTFREKNLTEVLKNHTYKNRFEEILDRVGVIYKKNNYEITLVLLVDDLNLIEEEVKNFITLNEKLKYKLLIVVSDNIEDIDISNVYISYNNEDVNVLAESYLKKYIKDNEDIIETDFFIITDSISLIDADIISKAMLHSCYTKELYVGFEENYSRKYILEESFLMKNVFSYKDKFKKSVLNFNRIQNSSIYYI
ncbi:CgeB family protein, partial [Psychrobacter sp. AOP30-A2-5]|uniref:CgeB family protein n=1 Tax=Psychrobacter sp. AOP30-A2-5 TaxID=3457697 RepID=UPI004035A058